MNPEHRQLLADTYRGLDRWWSVDDLYQRIAELLEREDIQGVLLGEADDESPLLALGTNHGKGRRVLVLGASSGVCLPGAHFSLFLLKHAAQLLGDWEVWSIPTLEPGRMRFNDPALSVRLKPADYPYARRAAWGPGESPEENLPIDFPPFWQPDAAPEDAPESFVPSSAGSLALARALHHLRPDLVVSFEEVPAAGFFLALSQELYEDDLRFLLQAVEDPVPLHEGAKLGKAGRQLPDHAGLVVLPSLYDEHKMLRSTGQLPDADSRLLGGVYSWQLLDQINPQAWYVQLFIPRYYSPSFGNTEPSDIRRDVEISLTHQERKGKTVPCRVVRLNAPDHPAHGYELRNEVVKQEEEVAEGPLHQQPAAAGWLAVEAYLTRRELVRQAREILERVRPSCRFTQHHRSLQLLRHACDDHDKLLTSFRQNKRYGRQATVAEAAYWLGGFRLETAALLAEARHGLDPEDARDREIEGALRELDRLIEAEVAAAEAYGLRPVTPLQATSAACSLILRSCHLTDRLGPQRRGLEVRIENTQRDLQAQRKEARNLKNLHRPKREREAAEKKAEEIEAQLKTLEEQYKRLTAQAQQDDAGRDPSQPAEGNAQAPEAREEEQPETTPQPDSTQVDEPSAKTSASPTSEQETDRHQRDDQSQQPSSPSLEDLLDLPLPPPPPGEPDQKDSTDPDERAYDAEEREEEQAEVEELPHEPPPEPLPGDEQVGDPVEAEEEDPWAGLEQFIKPSDYRIPAPEDRELDLESALPQQLPFEPEWGRGPLDWESQLPRDSTVPFAAWVDELRGSKHAEPPAVEAQSPTHLQPQEARPAEPEEEIVRSPVGFKRRRLELTAQASDVVPRLVTPAPTGGRYRPRRRPVS